MPTTAERHARNWRIAYWVLFAAWVGCAVLVMNGVRGGFVTNYGADLTQPAWLYIVVRELADTARSSWLSRTIGGRPEIAAAAIFAAGTVTEISQKYWPAGVFRGRYDPLDIVAFATGIGVCYLVDKFITQRRVYG